MTCGPQGKRGQWTGSLAQDWEELSIADGLAGSAHQRRAFVIKRDMCIERTSLAPAELLVFHDPKPTLATRTFNRHSLFRWQRDDIRSDKYSTNSMIAAALNQGGSDAYSHIPKLTCAPGSASVAGARPGLQNQ
jgi:hypothetical protein